jgi:hypothetical protein
MGGAAGRIFLSYRREDTRHMAGRLADRLDLRFGPGTVFMDVDAIAPGADFTRTIATEVSSCDLLIALIGRDWLTLDERTGQPRLHEDNDFVAIEIKAALDRGIYVIPVLVDQAKMPTSTELPNSLRRSRPGTQRDSTTTHSLPMSSGSSQLWSGFFVRSRRSALHTSSSIPRPSSLPLVARTPPTDTRNRPRCRPIDDARIRNRSR